MAMGIIEQRRCHEKVMRYVKRKSNMAFSDDSSYQSPFLAKEWKGTVNLQTADN